MLRLFNLSLIIFLLFTFLSFSQDEEVIEVKVSKDKVETGEVFTYRIKIEGSFTQPELTLPEFKDFKVISQSRSKNYAFKQGRKKVIHNLVYQLFAPNPGVFTIKEAVLEDRGKKFKSKSITIDVKGRPLKEKRKILPYIEKGIEI